MRLLVGYDGSDFARRALERAAAIAGSDGHVVVASVIPDGAHPGEMVGQQRLLEEAASLLGELGVSCETVEASGRPAEALAEAARDASADMIAVGTRGRGVAAGLLLGSVSTELARSAPCDVVIVR